MSEKSELGGGVFLHVCYMIYLNDPVAAILCSQIHYWYSSAKNGNSKLRVQKNGKFWIAKSRLEWSEETGLTDSQVKRGLNVLEREGVIEKIVKPFNGAPTAHIRATMVQGNVLKKGEYLVPIVIGKKSSVQITNPLVTDAESLAPHDQPLATGDQSITESTQEISTEITQDNLASKDADTLKSEKQKQTPEENIYSEVVNIVPVENKNGLGNSPEPITYTSHHEVWKKLTIQHANEYGEFLPLGKKELGQLKDFSQKLGDRTEPVLRMVFANWCSFGKYAKATYGAYSIPNVPTLDFISKHTQAALNYWKENAVTKDYSVPVAKGLTGPKNLDPCVPVKCVPTELQQPKNNKVQSTGVAADGTKLLSLDTLCELRKQAKAQAKAKYDAMSKVPNASAGVNHNISETNSFSAMV